MKTLTIALTLCFSALFAGQAEAGVYRKSNEYPARLVAAENNYCFYEVQSPYGVKLARAHSYDGCYRELWGALIGASFNLRLPYADLPIQFAKIIEVNQRRQVSHQSAPKNRQVAANYEANDAARLAAEAINGY